MLYTSIQIETYQIKNWNWRKINVFPKSLKRFKKKILFYINVNFFTLLKSVNFERFKKSEYLKQQNRHAYFIGTVFTYTI